MIKKITNRTILKQREKTYNPVEVEMNEDFNIKNY